MRAHVVIGALALGGCYLAHQLEAPPPDAGSPRDAGVDAPEPCGSGDIQVDATQFSMGRTSAGTVIASDPTGEVTRARVDEADGRARLCVPRRRAPVDLRFENAGGGVALLDVTSDARGEVRSGTAYWDPPSELDGRRPHQGRLVRSEPGSRFVIHVATAATVVIDESPFEYRCYGVFTGCRLRFIEESADGRLLGGGRVEQRHEDGGDRRAS